MRIKIFSTQFELSVPQRSGVPSNKDFEDAKEKAQKTALADLGEKISGFLKEAAPRPTDNYTVQWLQSTTVNQYGSFVQLTAIVNY